MPNMDLLLERVRGHVPLLQPWVLSDVRPVEVEMFETEKRLSVAQARRGPWKKARPGTRWGKPWSSAWFRIRFVLPREWKRRTVALRFHSGQALVFRNNQAWQGLDDNHPLLIIADPARGGERETILIESGASGRFGRLVAPLTVEPAEIAIYNRNFSHLLFEMQALLDIAGELPVNYPLRPQICCALDRALDAIDRVLRFPKGNNVEPIFAASAKAYGEASEAPELQTLSTPEEIEAAVVAARKELALVQRPASVPYEPTLWAVGHGHIDLAWRWPLEETIRKIGRTWSTQLQLCREFPSYVFTASQGCEYAYCKKHYPRVFAGIHEAVKRGQWEPLTSMWVESDCIINGGESLVRQFLWGIRWSLEEFGTVSNVVWLPDAFGYCAQLPQIMRRAGMRYFCTTKMWWNDTNAPAMTSFWWQGIDGSKILTHFPRSYNGRVSGGDLRRYPSINREADRVRDLLFIYGYGDGGGGPSRKQVYLVTSALRNQQGLPPMKPAPVARFFRQLDGHSAELPTWVGEHYNEFHRGTYTVQARTKRGNRLGEIALRQAELWATAARCSLRFKVLGDKLHKAWELLLHNQFHDILPGSSIGKVHEQAQRDYEHVLEDAQTVYQQAVQTIAGKVDTSGTGQAALVFNPLSWHRSGLVALPVHGQASRKVVTAEGNPVSQQVIGRGKQRRILFQAEDVPACGYATYRMVPGRVPRVASVLIVEPNRVRTPDYAIELDDAGRFTHLFDRRVGREVLPPGRRGNSFLLFNNLPNSVGTDAWDLNLEYRNIRRELDSPAEVRVIEKGPVRGTLRVRKRFSQSTLEQYIRFYAYLPRIDFVTRIDWHESHKLLKVGFPVDLDNPRATYEIQFGHLERSIHSNTSWDAAHFELPAQKWADLGEPGYGLSLLNDCKHGYDVFDGSLRLSLLKASKAPDVNADIGEHNFTYSIWPHPRNFREAGTIKAAYELNFPLRLTMTGAHPGRLPARHGWLRAEPDSVVVETIKPAEDGKGLVVRLYEAHGARAQATLSFGFDVRRVEEVDLIERRRAPVRLQKGEVKFILRPFEIRTLRIRTKNW